MSRTLALTPGEIGALDELLRAVRRGAHGRDLAQLAGSAPGRGLAAKAQAARDSIARQRALGLRAIEGVK